MDFNSITDAELLFQDMESGDVHLMHEVSAQFSHGLVPLNLPDLITGYNWCDWYPLQQFEVV